MPRLEIGDIGTEKRVANRTSKGRFVKRQSVPISFTVKVRRQTSEENRDFITAYKLFVSELVRRELSRMRSKS